MARWFTEDEVRQIVAEAVAEAVAPLKTRIAELEAEIARLKKNSTTSSKPPSSDIVKPPRPPTSGGKRGKRHAGGQPGHARHTRPAFPPEQVDQIRAYELPAVPPNWRLLDQFRVTQQVELVEKPYTVTEHRARLYENLRTGQVIAAPLPPEVRRAGLLGPRLTALVPAPNNTVPPSRSSIVRSSPTLPTSLSRLSSRYHRDRLRKMGPLRIRAQLVPQRPDAIHQNIKRSVGSSRLVLDLGGARRPPVLRSPTP